MNNLPTKFIGTILMSLITSIPVQANLVNNGSFELTSFPLTQSKTFVTAGLTGWSYNSAWNPNTIQGDMLILPGSGLQPFGTINSGSYPTFGLLGPFPLISPDGGNYVMSDGNFFNRPIQQSITGLTVGALYNLTFYQALAQVDEQIWINNHGPISGHWDVWFDDINIIGSPSAMLGTATSSAQMYADGSIPTISPWSLQTMTFKATSATQLLTFLSVGSGLPPMLGLDGVSLTAVPEPSTSWLWSIGLLGLIICRSDRKTA